MRIIFETQKGNVEAILNNSKTARLIYKNLPIEAKANTWGKEIYFSIPVKCEPENATFDVDIGDIAYWPEGSCLCIFFGRTPMSTNDLPKPASEVNIVGKVVSKYSFFKNIKSGDKIIVRQLD